MQSEAFFFISSIGFIVVGILLAILIGLLIRVSFSFMRILTKIEDSMDSIGDATMELIEEMRDNVFFRMFFHPKKNSRVRVKKQLPE